MLVHHAEEQRHGKVVLDDRGVRTHGTGNLTSLANGVSHGCHRLLGLHALRLAGFLLTHRSYLRRGDIATTYRRVVRWHGAFRAAIDTRGTYSS